MLDKEKKEKTPDNSLEEVFGPPISVYTAEQAIEDGLFYDAGRLGDKKVVLTTNLIFSLEKEEIVSALVIGLEKIKAFSQPDLAVYTVNGKKVYVDDSGLIITFMLPEDY